jgi:DNA mismatch repair protein MutL
LYHHRARVSRSRPTEARGDFSDELVLPPWYARASMPSDSLPCRIHILPPTLADQIAAGEVVERPASVVKELCENAVDAGARRVDVEIDAGGRRLIRVVDDGCGMTAEETRLALQRHATSKIRSADDLWGLATFGFRGEALPSIAAVSRLTLRTKLKGATGGFFLQVEAGLESDAGEVGMAEGTQAEVRDLFFNTPARLKFLKSEATEAANVSEAVLRLALAYPEVHFRLRNNGRVALDLLPHRDMAERVRAALARRGAQVLHEAEGEEGGVKVRAFLASPEEATPGGRSTFLFVGRRFVRDRALLHALAQGYGELLDKGRYPLAALFVDVPGQELDINVHPQKLEVRFSRPQEVYAAVRHVVGRAVARAPWLAVPPIRAYTLPPERVLEAQAEPLSELSPATPRDRQSSFSPPSARAPGPGHRDSAPLLPTMLRDEPLPAPGEQPTRGFFGGLAYIGQLRRTYLVCEGPSELVLVDQHAAHERIMFERLRVAHRQRAVVRQRLLFPIPIELDEAATAAAREGETAEALAGLGFEVEAFGPTTMLLRAVPDLLKDVDPKPLLRDVLHRVAEGDSLRRAEENFEQVFATMACHGALRAGDGVSREAALTLLSQLDAVDLHSHCPHGRPVLLRMSIAEIEQRLGRT